MDQQTEGAVSCFEKWVLFFVEEEGRQENERMDEADHDRRIERSPAKVTEGLRRVGTLVNGQEFDSSRRGEKSLQLQCRGRTFGRGSSRFLSVKWRW